MTANTGSSPDAGWVTARTAAGPGFRTELRSAAGHDFVADEPADVGGSGEGATPYDYLLASLAACTAMTLRMYAARKQWPLEEAVVRLRVSSSHAADCADCITKPAAGVGPQRVERTVELRGALSEEQRTRLLSIADRCPVKQVLERGRAVVPAAEPAAG
jgi:uncharacterized OsmC-like protein